MGLITGLFILLLAIAAMVAPSIIIYIKTGKKLGDLSIGLKITSVVVAVGFFLFGTYIRTLPNQAWGDAISYALGLFFFVVILLGSFVVDIINLVSYIKKRREAKPIQAPE
ncbi:MAG: hypothetical protein WCP14_01900 [bacterium]